MPTTSRCATVLALASLSWSAACPAHAAEDGAVCARRALDPAPLWCHCAAWSADGSELVVVDVGTGKLIRLGPDGEFLGSVRRPGLGEYEFNQPGQLLTVGDGWVLNDGMAHLVWLDGRFEPTGSLILGEEPEPGTPPAARALGIEDLGTAGDDLVGFGHVRMANGVQRHGFLRLEGPSSDQASLLEEVSYYSPAATLHNAMFSTIAEADGSVYALRFAEQPYVLQLLPTRKRLAAFPEGFEKVPQLPAGGAEVVAVVYRVLEKSTFGTGLFGRGGSLYLLTRKPITSWTRLWQPTGRTHWQLHRIDPRTDTLTDTLTLPTTANHLVLAPGPVHWALIEKGVVRGGSKQDISSMVLVPREWIEGEKSPLAGAEPGEAATLCR